MSLAYLSIPTFGKMTLYIKHLAITILSKLRITTFSITTHSITIFSMTTLSITSFKIMTF